MSFTKKQTGLISIAALLVGAVMSYWWTQHYTNTTNLLSDNITRSSILKEDITQKLLQCQATLTQIKQEFSHIQEDFTVLKREVTEVNNDITSTIEGVKANLSQIKLDFKNVQDNFVYSKNEVTKVFNGVTGTIEGVKKEMKEDYLLLKRDIQILTGTLLQSEDTEVNNSITGIIEGVKEKMKEDYLLLKRDMQILTGTQQIHVNKYITYSETILFLVAGLILEPLIIFLLYKYFPWSNGGYHVPDAHVDTGVSGSNGSYHGPDAHVDTGLSRSNGGYHGLDAHVDTGLSAQPHLHGVQHLSRQNTPRRMNILDEICSGNLEESICIISFYEETQDLHQRILTSALQQNCIPMKSFLLKAADPDALSIPRCRFVFVFVDFNERNVILENPKQEHGDKKVVTVKVCLKMGADVFVVYTRDRDSSHLEDGMLYNKDLSAFTGHFLLKELTAKNRGLSVNETFTQYQKNHIRGILKK